MLSFLTTNLLSILMSPEGFAWIIIALLVSINVELWTRPRRK